MARAIKCDTCGKCYVPDRKIDNRIAYPKLSGSMYSFPSNDRLQRKEWELCYDCFEKINTFILSLKGESQC